MCLLQNHVAVLCLLISIPMLCQHDGFVQSLIGSIVLLNPNPKPRGNTALHMCVYHDQTEMYDHLVEFCGASEHVKNNRGQTPMLLAASLGKVEMFQVRCWGGDGTVGGHELVQGMSVNH